MTTIKFNNNRQDSNNPLSINHFPFNILYIIGPYNHAYAMPEVTLEGCYADDGLEGGGCPPVGFIGGSVNSYYLPLECMQNQKNVSLTQRLMIHDS